MTQFLELLQIYKWSLPASIFMAAVLALIGAQWTAREKSAQIFVLGQGSSLGVVLGLALNLLLGTDFHGLSLLLGFCLGWVVLVVTEALIEKRTGRNHIYLTLFVFFLALTYLLTSITPSLESHMAASYFGDVAVMSDTGAQVCLLFALLFGGFLLKQWRLLTQISFQQVNHSWIHRSRKNLLFDFGTLLVTTMSVQNMGYLFTTGSLFIATTFAAARSHNLKTYTVKLVLISLIGSALGFALSLLSTVFPTVPCILIGQIIVGFLLYTKK
ncbi:metal ABC transporter permease [Bdellovibrio sp. 22V]|uniref:metal ABC transporter permease n=1 Tax=Bdellovibrio TaxID=958 RepID=UPI002543B661|nr:metal ABC transporter permease [Bdellovibrio sp. 22V]WII73080.1 metal ABC transporter permease [Bdellovibrio sp. 22V]